MTRNPLTHEQPFEITIGYANGFPLRPEDIEAGEMVKLLHNLNQAITNALPGKPCKMSLVGIEERDGMVVLKFQDTIEAKP